MSESTTWPCIRRSAGHDLNRNIDVSVKHTTLLWVAVALACPAGWRSMTTLSLDATPDLSETQTILAIIDDPKHTAGPSDTAIAYFCPTPGGEGREAAECPDY